MIRLVIGRGHISDICNICIPLYLFFTIEYRYTNNQCYIWRKLRTVYISGNVFCNIHCIWHIGIIYSTFTCPFV